MTFLNVYLSALPFILGLMTLLWLASIPLRNVSIVDLFWGAGFVGTALVYFFLTGETGARKVLVLVLVAIWGLRLSLYLTWRNRGKGEDFRYRKFRSDYGERRYWWVSFFQVFLLQGVLMWLVSAPLLGAMAAVPSSRLPAELNFFDLAALALWVTGFIFEAGGDLQLARFRSDPANRGQVLDRGFWRYTRHPNYFGDSAVWAGFGLFSIAAGNAFAALGSVLMIVLIIRVSGVFLLEKSLKESKPEYREYIARTSAFLPWFPKKKIRKT